MLKFPDKKSSKISIPQLYRQLQAQLNQWICPQDQRQLHVFCENVVAILQAQSTCLIPFHFKIDTNRQQGGREQGERI